MTTLTIAASETHPVTSIEDSVRALVDAGWTSAEEDLRRAAAAFDRAAEILRSHWAALQHRTRERLLDSCLDAAVSFRDLAQLDVVRSHAEVDEALAERVACL